MKNTNSNVKNQWRKKGAKVRVSVVLASYTRALRRSAQVGRKLSHEKNRLIRTKVHPALGKTSQLIIGGDDVFDCINSLSIVPHGIPRRNLNCKSCEQMPLFLRVPLL